MLASPPHIDGRPFWPLASRIWGIGTTIILLVDGTGCGNVVTLYEWGGVHVVCTTYIDYIYILYILYILWFCFRYYIYYIYYILYILYIRYTDKIKH